MSYFPKHNFHFLFSVTVIVLILNVYHFVVAIDYDCSSSSSCVLKQLCDFKGVTNLKWCDEIKSKLCCPNSLLYKKKNSNENNYDESSYSSYSSYKKDRVKDKSFGGQYAIIKSEYNHHVPIKSEYNHHVPIKSEYNHHVPIKSEYNHHVPIKSEYSTRYDSQQEKSLFNDYYEDENFEYSLSTEAKRILSTYQEKECGVKRSFYGKISSGHEIELGVTKYGEFPWQAAILLKIEEKYGQRQAFKYVCGGTVINPKLILTAAHCIKGIRLKNLKVKLGEWNLKGSQGEMFPSIERNIERAIIHDSYNSATFIHDMAILVLGKPVNLRKTPHVSQICLPLKRNKFDEYSKCFITGWGNDVYKPNYGSNILKVARVSLMKQDCRHKLKKSIPSLSNNFLKQDITCISGSLGKDACVGDGGGAVICPLKNSEVPVCKKGYSCEEEHYFIAGVISWGSDKCGQDGSVTVVTDFNSHYDWIMDKTRKYGGVRKLTDDKSRTEYGSIYGIHGYDDYTKNNGIRNYDEYKTPYHEDNYEYGHEFDYDNEFDYGRQRYDKIYK